MQAYDEAGVDPADPPPDRLRALVDRARHHVASPLRRAQHSLALLGHRPASTLELLREAPLPGPFPTSLALSPLTWQAVSRTAWLGGWSPDAESFRAGRRRARQGAAHLAELAAAHGSVCALGHGFQNFMIGVALRQQGFRARVPLRRGYWNVVVYAR
jgi:broad specificity phosphatase PhoE